MAIRRMAAVWAARFTAFISRRTGRRGSALSGKIALKICPSILEELSSQVREKIIVTCGTNGKTTTNNLICSALTEQGCKVVCNRAGANMLNGAASAFALAASLTGRLDADYACIEVDEASTRQVFPRIHPDLMVLTNLFRDQLDRYGEIDITMDILEKMMKSEPGMKVIVNGDDSLSAYLSEQAGNPRITYGVKERVTGASVSEIREGRFCKRCGARLIYRFYHYGQLGDYYCPSCGFSRPEPDANASRIRDTGHVAPKDDAESKDAQTKDAAAIDNVSKNTLPENTVSEKTAPGRAEGISFLVEYDGKQYDLHAPYHGFYNVYNILAAFTAVAAAGASVTGFQKMLDSFRPEYGRMERFEIGGSSVILNLAKNPAGFNQNIAAVLQDESPKDLVIAINDGYQDGRDISWLWDVDFDTLAHESIRSIRVTGVRCRDMGLRLKYVDIPHEVEPDLEKAIEQGLSAGTKNLYVLVNYTVLYAAHDILKRLASR